MAGDDVSAELADFPVDEATLTAVDRALDSKGTLDYLLMVSTPGYDPSAHKPLLEGDPALTMYVGGPVYEKEDLIRSLIVEIRRLRAAIASPSSKGGDDG